MNVIARLDVEILGHKVVLGGRIRLHNVAALSANIQIEDAARSVHAARTRANFKRVRAVLERATRLRRVEGQLQRVGRRIDRQVERVKKNWVLRHGGLDAIVAAAKRGEILVSVLCGNVVAQSQRARPRGAVGNGPVVHGSVAQSRRVAQMVVAVPRSRQTLGRRVSVGRSEHPGARLRATRRLIVGPGALAALSVGVHGIVDIVGKDALADSGRVLRSSNKCAAV
jgi:hypothetical protein